VGGVFVIDLQNTGVGSKSSGYSFVLCVIAFLLIGSGFFYYLMCVPCPAKPKGTGRNGVTETLADRTKPCPSESGSDRP
jgi:hypothetical protein